MEQTFAFNWFFHLLFLGFFFLAALLFLRLEHMRGRAFLKITKTLGFSFLDKPGEAFPERLRPFRLFRFRGSHHISQWVEGDLDGERLVLFNCLFKAQTRFSTYRGGFLCGLIRLPTPWPAFALHPAGLKRETPGALLGQTFSTPELQGRPYRLFSESWSKGGVERLIHGLSPKGEEVILEVHGTWCLYAREGELVPGRVTQELAALGRLALLLKTVTPG